MSCHQNHWINFLTFFWIFRKRIDFNRKKRGESRNNKYLDDVHMQSWGHFLQKMESFLHLRLFLPLLILHLLHCRHLCFLLHFWQKCQHRIWGHHFCSFYKSELCLIFFQMIFLKRNFSKKRIFLWILNFFLFPPFIKRRKQNKKIRVFICKPLLSVRNTDDAILSFFVFCGPFAGSWILIGLAPGLLSNPKGLTCKIVSLTTHVNQEEVSNFCLNVVSSSSFLFFFCNPIITSIM